MTFGDRPGQPYDHARAVDVSESVAKSYPELVHACRPSRNPAVMHPLTERAAEELARALEELSTLRGAAKGKAR